jgi:hypothetical protein
MAMVVSDLADALKSSIGFGALATSSQNTGFAKAVIDEMQAALVNNAPGTINGTAPSSGGPLIGGTGINGLITGMTPVSLAARMIAEMGFPSPSAEIIQFATAICAHLQTVGSVSFTLITGNCTNTPVSPGALIGEGSNGQIVNLSGPVLAAAIAVVYGGIVSPELLSFSTALVTYIMSNASVTYTTGSVTGVCSAGGGPIAAGAGVGGTIA